MHANEYLQLKRKNWIIGHHQVPFPTPSVSSKFPCPCTFQSQLALIAALKFWKQIFILLLTLCTFFRVCPKQFAVLITAMITGRAATFFFCSVLLRSTFLKGMLPTTSNIIQALEYKHFDKILALYISSLLPSFFSK